MPYLRPAERKDAAHLAALAETTFRDTFGAANRREDMDDYCRQTYAETIQAGEIADATRLILVLEEASALIGFTYLRWDKVPEGIAAKFAGEIQRLYITRDWHGKGVAQLLMEACLGKLQERGADLAWLGVWERNPRAISFYRKFGFSEAGEQVFTLGADRQRDIVMTRRL